MSSDATKPIQVTPTATQEAVREAHRSPATGQFGPQGRTAPEGLALTDQTLDLVSLHGRGTFDFPGSFSDADDLVEFWSTVEVPEKALLATQLAYKARWDEAWQEAIKDYEGFAGACPRNNLQDMRAWGDARLKYVQENHANYPKVQGTPRNLSAHHVRPLVIATKMWASAHTLAPEERDKVHKMMVKFPSYEKPLPVERLVQWYRSHDIEKHMNEYSPLLSK